MGRKEQRVRQLEIRVHPDLAFQITKVAWIEVSWDRNHLGRRLTGSAESDLLAVFDPPDEIQQLSFGIPNIHHISIPVIHRFLLATEVSVPSQTKTFYEIRRPTRRAVGIWRVGANRRGSASGTG